MKNTAQDSIRRVLTEGFSARDIAEPLVSFDIGADQERVLQTMEQQDFDVVGIRENGLVVGYVERDKLKSASIVDCVRRFSRDDVTLDSTSLADVVTSLVHVPRRFVSVLGTVGGIVTHGDLEKAPVRMWLFGMVTIIEMRFQRLIERHCPDDQWKQYLSAGRLEKAAELLEERKKRDQELELVDCLQFADKGQILMRDEGLKALMKFGSRRQAEQLVRALEALRNNLAHSQDIVSCDWETIVLLSENLDRVITGPKKD